MANDTRIDINLFGPAGSANARLNGVNNDRQTRFAARAARRWGDWDEFLVFPAPLLWLESEPVFCFGDECAFTPPEVIELWP
jgi:hypothetical protein